MPSALPLLNKISQTSQGNTSFRLNVAQFGDSYSQRVPDGINYTQRKWTINYENLTATELQTVQTFVETVGGGAYFTWQPPGVLATLKWVLDGEVSVTALSGNVWTVSLTCKQVYDIT